MTRRKKGQSIGPNQLLWDLGVDDIYDDEQVQERIGLMEEKFHLVMILENFEVPSIPIRRCEIKTHSGISDPPEAKALLG